MRTVQQGFILLPVLIFFQLCAIVSLHDLFTVFFWRKSNLIIWEKHQYEGRIKAILQTIETKLMFTQLPPCLIDPKEGVDSLGKSLSWWEAFSCSGNFGQIRYYYVVEFLDADACGVVNGTPNQNLTAFYYRITLYAIPPVPKGAKRFLESIIVKGEKNLATCSGKLHRVQAGRQMYRYLIARRLA